MNLQELRYFVAAADHRHFGRAAAACHVSQPCLSGQLRKLEEHLGVALFERSTRRVALTPAGQSLLEHARKALEEAAVMEAIAKAAGDQLSGPLRLGVIPTLAPYLVPRILKPLREDYPRMPISLWEDLTHNLVEMLCAHKLDAALIATEPPTQEVTAVQLFEEPFAAAVPWDHALAKSRTLREADLAPDLMVLADGHCLALQSLRACGRPAAGRSSFQAASLDTLVGLVASGYGTTLVPALAVRALERTGVVFRALEGGASRIVRLASRPAFPRPKALQALEKVIRDIIRVCQYGPDSLSP
jgi:LysR family hydrogen peroxide-inducible transcriptional activator